MQYYYHEQLAGLDDNGFGVIWARKVSTYMPAHWHGAVELVLFMKGKMTCKFSHSTIHAQPGEVFLINSHDVHETRCTRGAQYLVVHILPSQLSRFHAGFDQLSFSLKHDPDDPEKHGALEQLKAHMTAILQYRKEGREDRALEIQSRLFAMADILVTHFSQHLALEEAKLQRSDMTRLEPLLEYTRLHHSEELTSEAAADSLGLNKEYFCRLFKKNMGVSYLTYLNQIRATALCRELETSDDPIGELGEKHGFANPKMMNQYFREVYGCTPSEKRKAFREMVLDGVY
jgi:AraC-like DNA-binding protein/quercetin dioxygenase-like cupin family protein